MAALLKAMDGALPVRHVCLAAVLALEPRLLLSYLGEQEAATWRGLVGGEADRRLVDDVARFAELINQQDTAASELRDIATTIETERERVGAFRDKQVRVFGRLSEKFDPIIRRLVGPEAQGRIALTGNGVELTVKMGGDRSTAAIDSLKVLAFDLSALCLSIEGVTRVPAFLVHDSPREADLGLTLYHQLFRLARWLEEVGGQPLFQYIVTTTTRPPSDLAKDPWMRLTVRGAPASERLLRCDL